MRAPLPALEELGPVKVTRGVEDHVGVNMQQPESVIIRSGQQVKLTQEPTLTEEVEAPVEAGQKLGSVTVKMDGETLLEYDLVAASAIQRMTMLKGLEMLLSSLLDLT